VSHRTIELMAAFASSTVAAQSRNLLTAAAASIFVSSP
jgi:hypothetical protein